MKNCFLILALLANLFILSAQDYSFDFGRISQKEADLQFCPEDTAAPAVVLYDLGISNFVSSPYGNNLCFERAIKIKIFNTAGFKYATIEIQYYKELELVEQVIDIEAYTYNYVNKTLQKSELKSDQIFEKKIAKNLYSKVFTLPDIHEGSIIEYRYKIKSPFLFNLHDWEFQSLIPVNYSKYTVTMVPFYEYIYILQGRNKFDEYNKIDKTKGEAPSMFDQSKDRNHEITHEYIMKNVPAFTPEQYITSEKNYIIKMDFQICKVNHSDGTTTEYMTT